MMLNVGVSSLAILVIVLVNLWCLFVFIWVIEKLGSSVWERFQFEDAEQDALDLVTK